jgi:predicted exporter
MWQQYGALCWTECPELYLYQRSKTSHVCTSLHDILYVFIPLLYILLLLYRHLTKLHEAVSNILPETQVENLYRTVNKTFKDKLRDQLMKMNVVNNGGPQHG